MRGAWKVLAVALPCMLGIGATEGCDSRPVVAQRSGGSGWLWWPSRLTTADKLDLLLVVDDSPGMADKQRAFARSLPVLLRDVTTRRSPRSPFATGPDRALDVHVAVLTSSLGSHGTSACTGEHANGHGHLLPRPGDDGCATSPRARSGGSSIARRTLQRLSPAPMRSNPSRRPPPASSSAHWTTAARTRRRGRRCITSSSIRSRI